MKTLSRVFLEPVPAPGGRGEGHLHNCASVSAICTASVYVVLNYLLAFEGECFILNSSLAVKVGSLLSNGSLKGSLLSMLPEKRTCESCGEFTLNLGICHLLSLLVPIPPR